MVYPPLNVPVSSCRDSVEQLEQSMEQKGSNVHSINMLSPVIVLSIEPHVLPLIITTSIMTLAVAEALSRNKPIVLSIALDDEDISLPCVP